MNRLTFADWVHWGQRGAIAACDTEVRNRFEQFVTRHVAKGIGCLPERERNLLQEYVGPSSSARLNCSSAFDLYMLQGRKLSLLLRARPTNAMATEDDQARIWSSYAVDCIRSMVREVLFRSVTWGQTKPVDLNARIEGKNTEVGDLLSGSAVDMQDEMTLNEIEKLTQEFALDERQRLILWAYQDDEPRCSVRMQDLAGCGRSQLSDCARVLESRLRDQIVRLFSLSPHEKEKVEALTFWAWQILALRFRNLYPEKGADGALIFKTRETPVWRKPE